MRLPDRGFGWPPHWPVAPPRSAGPIGQPASGWPRRIVRPSDSDGRPGHHVPRPSQPQPQLYNRAIPQGSIYRVEVFGGHGTPIFHGSNGANPVQVGSNINPNGSSTIVLREALSGMVLAPNHPDRKGAILVLRLLHCQNWNIGLDGDFE